MTQPEIPENLISLSRDELRKLASMCGLHTSRSSKALMHDLQLIREGRQQEISLFNWQQAMLTYQPQISIGMCN